MSSTSTLEAVVITDQVAPVSGERILLRNLSGSLGGLRFGPIDSIYAVAGLFVIIAGSYAWAALPETRAAPARTAGAGAMASAVTGPEVVAHSAKLDPRP